MSRVRRRTWERRVRMKQPLGFFVGTAMLLSSFSLDAGCGGERRLVQVAADQNAVEVADFARTAGIAELGAIAAPQAPAARPSARFAPAEFTVYTVSGTLLAIDRTVDGDDRLVIADPQQPQTMIVAVAPDPACAAGSRFADNIVAVHNAIERKFGTFSRLTPDIPVTATGIAYFSARRGEPGTAPNGIELHPLMGFAFP
jgi:hypothetical protein